MKKLTISIIMLCLCITKFAFAQTVIHVPADQATIQAAVNAASNNDIIMVANGTYNESINLNSGPNGISIIAENAGNVTINGNTAPVFTASAHTGDITINGFVLNSNLNANSQGVIDITNLTGHLTVINNTLSAANTNGVKMSSTTTSPVNTSILNNSFGSFGNDDLIKILVGEDGNGGDANILIDGNTNTGTLEDDAIEVTFENSNSNATLVVTNNNFSNWTGTGNGIDVFLGSGSPAAENLEVHFTIADNTLTHTDGTSLLINLDGINNTIYGTMSNNTIVGDAINTDHGMYIDGDSTSNGVTAYLTIENNNISNVIGNGIYFRPYADDVNTDVWNMIVKNNTISNPNADNSPADMSQAGILISDSSGANDENYIVNTEINNNTITNLNGVTDCIIIARPTSTTVATAVINYEASGNSCAPTLFGSPTLSVDPVPNTSNLLEIGDLVWNDLDGNGLKDAGEQVVQGVVIQFTGNGFTGSSTSNTNGIYTLPALIPGTYTLTAVPTSNFPDVSLKNVGSDATIDNDFDPVTKTVMVTLTAGGTTNLDIDLGIYNGSTLSLSETNLQDISIYPNPISNQFTINTQLTNYSYEVYSIQGQLIASKQNNRLLQHIDASEYPTGIYVIVISSKAKTASYKLIKK